MKDRFSLLNEKLSFSKTIMFLSFQIAKKRLKGIAFHIILVFFLTGNVVHSIIRSFSRRGPIHSWQGNKSSQKGVLDSLHLCDIEGIYPSVDLKHFAMVLCGHVSDTRNAKVMTGYMSFAVNKAHCGSTLG